MELMRKTVGLLRSRLRIPKDYQVLFTSSATECWEIIAQSLTTLQSIHIFNGAFGEKWFDYARRLHPLCRAIRFDVNTLPDPSELVFPEGEVIAITQNETSNGTQVSSRIIAAIRHNNPSQLIAVDATSSMAGVFLDFHAADVWFASVQKCFGLPAGLGVMIVSPRAIDRVRLVNENLHYNSLALMVKMAEKSQTSYTPNVLGIYLLMRCLQKREAIGGVEKKIKSQARDWHKMIRGSKKLFMLSAGRNTLSDTVIAIRSTPELVAKIKTEARRKGFLLGEGYGSLKQETFRIANFPAIKAAEVRKLMTFIRRYC